MAIEDDDARSGRSVYWEILRRVEQKVDKLDTKVDASNRRLDQFFFNEFSAIQAKIVRMPDPEIIITTENFDANEYVLKRDFRPIQWAFYVIVGSLFLVFVAAILAALGIHPYFEGVVK